MLEDDGVAFIFGSLGWAPNKAIQRYLNQRGVPQLFVADGKDDWADPTQFPWTMGLQPSSRLETRLYGRYLLAHKPGAKICVLYQNDTFGRDHLDGLKEGLTPSKYAQMVVKESSYEITDPSIDPVIPSLQAAGCDTLVAATIPKFGAQAIRAVFNLGWKPTFFVSSVSASIVAVRNAARSGESGRYHHERVSERSR